MEKFEYDVDVGAAGEDTFFTVKVAFGDGYEQRTARGLLNLRETWNIQVETTKLLALEVRDFLLDHKTILPFLWVTPMGDEIKVKAKEINMTGPDGGENYKVTAKFIEEI